MLDLNEFFEKLDQINDAEKLTEMKKLISDSYYTKMFWAQRLIALLGETDVEKARARLKCGLIAKMYSASIPIRPKVKRFITPHGFAGIHISAGATIGQGCVIFQHVVIGSNLLLDSKSQGFPVIGENVFLGAGSMVIGNVRIGNNVRIGANCVVTKDVPDNCLVVGAKAVVIQRDEPMDNRFFSVGKYKKIKAEMEMEAGAKTDGNDETDT